MQAASGNLRQRLISALVLAAIGLVATVAGGWIFRVMACVLALTVFLEWLWMYPGEVHPRRPVLVAAFAAAVLPLLFGFGGTAGLLAGLLLGAAAALLAETGGQGLWVARGFAYAFLPAWAIIALRGDSAAGLVAVLFLYAVVWATDIGAYFAGRRFGGPRLAPSVSPGKTWSGAAGGLLAGALAGAILVWTATGTVSAGTIAGAMLLSVVAQLGDLYESSVKREAGVKDSSQLIPGHGGVMDRVDGLAFAAVALYLLATLAPAWPAGH